MRGATKTTNKTAAVVKTSIHAPHAWGDLNKIENGKRSIKTSIHAPHAWGDEVDDDEIAEWI